MYAFQCVFHRSVQITKIYPEGVLSKPTQRDEWADEPTNPVIVHIRIFHPQVKRFVDSAANRSNTGMRANHVFPQNQAEARKLVFNSQRADGEQGAVDQKVSQLSGAQIPKKQNRHGERDPHTNVVPTVESRQRNEGKKHNGCQE